MLFLLIGANVYLAYKAMQLQKQLNKLDKDHKKQLAEAGNAITDTLRVAFDNLKRNTGDHNKINSKLTEHNSRIHRLEQNMNRSLKEERKQTLKVESTEENENE